MKKTLSLIFIILFLFSSCELAYEQTPYDINLITIALDYSNTDVNSLNGTINDAREIEKAFRESCKRNQINYTSNNFYQIGTSYDFQTINNNQYPKKANILKALDELINSSSDSSINIIYYSGHSDSTGSWLLGTTDSENGDSFDRFDIIKYDQILSVNEIYKKLKLVKGKKLLIVDSCYSGNFKQDSPYSLDENNFTFDSAYKKLLSNESTIEDNIFILCATEKNNYAHEPTYCSGQRLHGYFTKALLEGMGWCDGEKGVLTYNCINSLTDNNGIQGTLATGLPPAAKKHCLSIDSLDQYIKQNQDILLKSEDILIEHQYPQITGKRFDLVLFKY